MPNTQGNSEGQDFVERVEMAIMQFVMLSKAQRGEVTKDNLKQTFKGNLQMHGDHFDHCIDILVKEKHLKDVGGGKYAATDDGREDVQKLQAILLEVPNVIEGGQGQKSGIAQQKSVGGSTSGSGGYGGQGGSTGSTVGSQGTMGSSSRQGHEVGSGQPTTSGGNTMSKGGATQPTGNKPK